MSGGFYKRRRGILEHLEAGTISLLDLAVHDYLNLKANLVVGSDCSIPPGVCITSAAAIHATCPSQISERAVQRSLEHLQKIGWIKRWNVRGRRGNYPVLVCRGSVHDLSGKEYRVNGEETRDWKHPALAPVGELSPSREIADTLLSPYREVRTKNREQRKTPAASQQRDSRFQLFVEYAFKTFEEKCGQKPVWSGRDYKALNGLLKGNPDLPLDELKRRWGHYQASTDSFITKQGVSLAFFASYIDRFIDGPQSDGTGPRRETPSPKSRSSKKKESEYTVPKDVYA